MNISDYDNGTDLIGSIRTTDFEALSIPPKRPLWIADLVFYRFNRSVKYGSNGELLITAEITQWNDLWPRLFENLGFLLIYFVSIILSFILFFISLSRAKRSDHRKVQCIIANLAASNILLSSGFLIYTYLLDVYYDVDSFNTLLNSNNESKFYSIWPAAKQVIHHVLIDNISLSQSFIILMLSFDRYLSLFEGYKPYVKRTLWKLIPALLPYFFACVIFDLQLMAQLLGNNIAVVIRLAAFMAPIPLSLVFTVCSIVGYFQKSPSTPRRKHNDLSCSIALLIILFFQLIEKFGFFMQLLHENFNFEIVVGNPGGDRTLKYFLGFCYTLSKLLFLLSPLYSCILILLMVRFYQRRMIGGGQKLWRMLRCKSREPLDYNTETMRSIIAEQARQRQMKAFGY
jgi:hypothetical protein